ncbi:MULTISPECIES: hypothetical protein [unclassified Dolichospermum]|uniref:hypothetical protein n=1 Tax=unclassified Dolichospermum TaxID=2622029 RepID=UPI001445FCBE|nr:MULTISPECIES: hypothetical protein [unclassified Dolichospermum]MTJ16052.1 hypothetical protein [Dolichospermum sp. UHCC 0299]MTJ39869.1 hypothetical protein [Dolichospermum sp. UHCC 0406]
MLRIFSTHRLFGFLLIGLMITSCGGGTSSNTPSGGAPSGGGGNTTSETQTQTPPRTLTVSVPSLGTSYTVTESTTYEDITTATREAVSECTKRFSLTPNGSTTCQAEVRAAIAQALAFIGR